jgi:hypothetical protein
MAAPETVMATPTMVATVLVSGRAGLLLQGHRMVQWHRSPSLCVETAVHYEHQAERASDPVARQKFLDLAFEWRKSALMYESMEAVGIVPSADDHDSESLELAAPPSR